MTRSSTAIVMADNRAPSSSTPTYPALAFALNALYACGHGYDLLYYRMASPTCAHPLQGARDASYCKMPAIAACLLYTSPSPRDGLLSRMPSSA